MNLTDLQEKLRTIEEQIAALYGEIENMKPQKEEKGFDYDRITRLAEKYPIKNECISATPMSTKKLIFSSMAYILLTEDQNFYDRILYLCRLSAGCGFTGSAEELYELGLAFEDGDLKNLCMDISDEYKYTYFVELFVMANISKGASVNILSIIADLASCFGISKEEIRVLAMMAKSILIEDIDYMDNMPVPKKNIWSGKLREYISEEWVAKRRICCDTLCVKERTREMSGDTNDEDGSCVVKKFYHNGDVVRKGDVICSCLFKKKCTSSSFSFSMLPESQESNIVEQKVKASSDGVVYFITYKEKLSKEEAKILKELKEKPAEFISVYVTSYFDTYTEVRKQAKK